MTKERLQEIKEKYRNGVPEAEITEWINGATLSDLPLAYGADDYDLDYEEEFEWKGRLYTVKELADIAGINAKIMSCRLDRYKTMDEVMAVKPIKKKAASSTKKAERIAAKPKKEIPTKKIENIAVKPKKEIPAEKNKIRRYLYHGNYYKASELARLAGVSRNTMYQRLAMFDNVEDAVNKPYNTKARNNIGSMLEAGGISKQAFYDACRKGVTLKEFFGVKI